MDDFRTSDTHSVPNKKFSTFTQHPNQNHSSSTTSRTLRNSSKKSSMNSQTGTMTAMRTKRNKENSQHQNSLPVDAQLKELPVHDSPVDNSVHEAAFSHRHKYSQQYSAQMRVNRDTSFRARQLSSSTLVTQRKNQAQEWSKKQDDLDANLRMVEQLSAQRNEILRLKANVRSQKMELSTRNETISECNNNIRRLKNQLEQDRQKYSNQLDALERQVDARKDDEDIARTFEVTVKRLRLEVSSLKLELDRAKEDSKGYQSSNLEIRRKLEKLSTDLTSERTENKTLQARLYSLAERESSLKERVDVLHHEAVAKEDEIRKGRYELAELRKKAETEDKTQKQFQDRMDELEKLIRSRSVKSDEGTVSVRVSSEKPVVREEPSSKEETEMQIVALKRQLESQQVEMSVLNQKIRTLKRERDQARLRIQTEREAHEEAFTKTEDESKRLRELSDKLREAEWGRVEAEKKTTESDQESQRLLQELNTMSKSMEEVLTEMDEMKRSIEYLSQEREDAIQLIDSLESEIEQAHALRRMWQQRSEDDTEEGVASVEQSVSPDDIAAALCHLYNRATHVSKLVMALVSVIKAQLNGEPLPMQQLLGVGDQTDQTLQQEDMFQVPTLEECNNLVSHLKEVSETVEQVKADMSDAYAEAVGNDCYVQ